MIGQEGAASVLLLQITVLVLGSGGFPRWVLALHRLGWLLLCGGGVVTPARPTATVLSVSLQPSQHLRKEAEARLLSIHLIRQIR